MPPTTRDNATIANSSVRSASVSRGERFAYQKCRYQDLCGCSGAMAIRPLVAVSRAVWDGVRGHAIGRGRMADTGYPMVAAIVLGSGALAAALAWLTRR